MAFQKALANFSCFDMRKGMSKEAPRITRNKWMAEVLTRGKMEPIIEDLKDFIRSIARGTEHVLRKEIEGVRGEMNDTSVQLRSEMKDMSVQLRSEMKDMSVQLRGEMRDMSVQLRSEMRDMEGRLTEKIDGIGKRVDSHGTRLSAIEEKVETPLAVHP